MKDKWLTISSAPKGATAENPWKEHWILGTNGMDCRVIRWCVEEPLEEGEWIYDQRTMSKEIYYDYSEFSTYHPTHWMPLPELPSHRNRGVAR